MGLALGLVLPGGLPGFLLVVLVVVPSDDDGGAISSWR